MTSNTTRSPSKILLVDDERSIRITLSEFLKDENYKVEVAEDAQQAMEMLSRDDFDVVVTDIIMPRITGVKLLEAIRESASRVQVILMTGEPTVETASKAVRADAFDYLTKPISKGKLIRTVANAVKVKTLDDEHRRLIKENLRYQENLEELVKERTAALQRKHRELTLLNRIIATTSTTLDSKKVLATICRELALAFDVPQAAATLLNKTRTTATVVAEYLAEGRPSAMDIELPVEDNFATQYVIEYKAPLSIIDAQHDPRLANIHEKVKERGTVSILILPLQVRDEVVGTLGLDTIERHEFSNEEINLAANAVAATSQALENARLYQTIQRELDERVRAEKAQRESEEKYRNLIEITDTGYLVIDRNSVVIDANEEYFRLTGRENLEEILGKSVIEWIATYDLERNKREVEKCFQKGFVRGLEIDYVDGKGKITPVEINASVIDSGKEKHIVALCRDITERKEASQSLKKYASRLETLNIVTAALSRSLELDDVLKLILDQVRKVIPLDSGEIFLREEEGLRVMADYGIVPSTEGLVFSAESLLFKKIEQTKLPLLLSDVKKDNRFLNWEQSENIESWMGVPLILRDTVIGFLTLDSFQPNAFSAEQAKFALSFASQAAQALENARLYQTLEYELAERKRAEEKIRLGRKNQRILLDNIQTQVWYLKDERTYGVVNQTHAVFCGIAVESLAHSDIFASFPTETAEEKVKNNSKVFQTRQKLKNEVWMPNASGEERLLSILRTPELDQEGNVKFVVCSAEDITERKAAEKALQQSEERYKRFSEVTNEGIFFHDKGTLLDANTSFAKIFGFEPDELIGKNIIDTLALPEYKKSIHNNIAKGYKKPYQILARKKNGTIFPVELQGREISYKGELVRVASIKDITERKESEDKIQRHLAELEVLYESGLAISGLLDQKEIANKIIETLKQKLNWNHVAIRLYHSESDRLELLGLNLLGVGKTETQKQMAHLNKMVPSPEQGVSGWVIKNKKSVHIEDLSKDKRYVESYTGIKSGLYAPMMVGDKVIGSIAVESKKKNAFSHQDERLLFTLANQAAISLENTQLYLEIQQELKERLLAQEDLSKLNLELEERVLLRTAEIESARSRMALATSAAGFGIWEIMENTDTQFWDKQMYKIYGTSPNKYQPSFSNWLKFISPEDRDGIIENRTQLFQNEIPYEIETEYRIIRTDGSHRHISTHAIMLFDEKEKCKKIVGVDMDITAIKKAEETMRLANTELERALRIKDEFLANMSHELRTPLNAILGLTESLIEKIAGPVNEKQEKYLRTVNESGRHLLELINDILDLAKVESSEVSLHIEKVNIHDICESSMVMLKQAAQKKRQKTSCEIDESINLIWADERRLKQTLVNLLSNAVKFTPEGKNLGIKVEADYRKKLLYIKVWDEGVGISKEDRERIFTPFVQIDSGLARKSVGTGLGLALVRQLVKLHNGNINLESIPEEGSVFTISLPWTPAIQTSELPSLPPRKEKIAQGKGKTILLVEDTEAVIMMLKDYLEKRGYQIIVANNGLKGVAKAKEIHPDLILMDVMMPLMDGLEATQKIKDEPSLKKTPIIGMTALAMPEDRENCLKAGMDDYMSKPIIFNELLSMIEKHLKL